ncbi:MAG TPA: site-specific integrase [Thermoanaerobaculia bacterium]|nr:site-specific integrase [Thermoanaerobaculia bacterium]
MSRRAAQKLTKRFIDDLEPGKKGGTWYGDADLPGLYVVSYPTGAKVFIVRFLAARRRRAVVVGKYGILTLEKARQKAKMLLSDATLGGDPATARDRARRTPTFATWADTYLSRVHLEKKSPRDDEKFIGEKSSKGKALRARWGSKPLDTITPEDVAAFRDGLRREKRKTGDGGGETAPAGPKGPPPTTANRWLASVRSCFNAAVREGHLAANPARSIPPFRENPPRARVLSTDEMERLLRALARESDPHIRAAFRLLIETGARLSEVLGARWADIDFESRLWRIPSPKAGRPQVFPLGERTVEMLRKLPRVGAFLIPPLRQFAKPGSEKKRERTERPRADLRGPWDRLRQRAQLEDVRIHDIRRSFGLEIARKAGLHVASKLLRHSSVKVTEQVYAPLGIDELRDAVEKRADVLPFPDQKRNAG